MPICFKLFWQLTRRAAGIFETLAGPVGLDYAYAIANLAAVLADQGENARAQPVLRRAIFLIEKLDKMSPALLALEANLGLVYLRQGDSRKAETLLTGVLAAFESTGDPAQAGTLAALAELSIAEGRWIDADSQIRRAYQLAVARQGETHPSLFGILHLKAIVEAHSGDPRYAVSDMKRAIDLLEALAGPSSPTLAPFLDEYAAFLRQAKQRGAAKATLRRARAIRRGTRP